MKREQPFGDDEGGNDRDKEKHSRLSNLNEIPEQNCNYSSPPCKENVNTTTTFNASARALIENINLKTENANLQTALKDAAIEIRMKETEIENMKNKAKKEKGLAQKFMHKSDDERVEEKKKAIKAVAELERIKGKFSQTLSNLKSKEAEILQLQNQITEMNKAENEKFNAEIKEWKDRVSRRDKKLKEEKKRTDKAVSREKKYCQMMKAKEKRISELQILHKKKNDKFGNLEKLEKLENEIVQYKSKNESLERLLKELLEAEKANKVEIATLQKELASVTEELNSKKKVQSEQETLYESFKIELLEDQLTDAKKMITEKDEIIANLQKQIFGKKNDEIQNAGTSSKTFEYQISKLENTCDSLRQQIEAIKEKANDDLKKANDENESLERRLNEHLEAEQKSNEEIAVLQKELNSVTEELKSKKKAEIEKEKLYESYKAKIFENAKKMVFEKDEIISDLQTQIEERQQIIDEKDENICDLHTQLNNQQKEIDLKNAEIQKVKTSSKTLEKELENTCNTLRQQIGAIKEKSKNDLKKADDEIEKLEIKLVDSIDECQRLNNSIEEKANKMFKEWKNREKEEKQNCNCIVKDNIIRKLKEELATEKELNETFMNASNASFNNVAKWIVPIEVCQHMYDSSGAQFMPFLQQYLNRLFTNAEILLPEDYCKEKFNELKAVISHFLKNEGDETKEMYYVNIKQILNNKRYNGRRKYYLKCDSLHSVAITSEGNSFFYSLNNDKIWQPYSDQSSKNILEYKKISSSVPFSDPFGIPSAYSTSKYILIIQSSPSDGQKLIKMIPKIGIVELISKKLKTEK
uniref:Uncharacterized protein n=1 Tax=Panagrolaimus sp. PS1159 TaxID=55785 RepID=A0AC35GEI5_9BILA